MLKQLLTIFLMVTVFAGGFFYFTIAGICEIPLEYRIGVLDERFGITETEALAAIADAELIWEDATGLNLFSYTGERDAFPINFIFDERQERTEIEQKFEARLDKTEALNNRVNAEQQALGAEYDALEIEYETAVAAHQARSSEHERTVAEWNSRGGAPPEVFAEIEAERLALNAESDAINDIVVRLNQIAAEMKALNDQSREIVETFNNSVETFNNNFGDEREFTQGDYQGDKINIYQFGNGDELRSVLAHELGHAIHLRHVPGEASIMHYLSEAGERKLVLSPYDQAEFDRVCGDGTLGSKFTKETFFRLFKGEDE